ncbi:MAG TPA: hypothetical protein VHT72_01390 [Puia sp.]|nr:hypothetical protein [Puia sp.]
MCVEQVRDVRRRIQGWNMISPRILLFGSSMDPRILLIATPDFGEAMRKHQGPIEQASG